MCCYVVVGVLQIGLERTTVYRVYTYCMVYRELGRRTKVLMRRKLKMMQRFVAVICNII